MMVKHFRLPPNLVCLLVSLLLESSVLNLLGAFKGAYSWIQPRLTKKWAFYPSKMSFFDMWWCDVICPSVFLLRYIYSRLLVCNTVEWYGYMTRCPSTMLPLTWLCHKWYLVFFLKPQLLDSCDHRRPFAFFAHLQSKMSECDLSESWRLRDQ